MTSPGTFRRMSSRPFGAHIAMRWWVSILLTLLVVGATYILHLLFLAAAAIVEVGLWGKDPNDPTLTPLYRSRHQRRDHPHGTDVAARCTGDQQGLRGAAPWPLAGDSPGAAWAPTRLCSPG